MFYDHNGRKLEINTKRKYMKKFKQPNPKY